MSLEMRLGKRGNLLTPGPDSYAQLLLKSPVLLESELAAVTDASGLSTRTFRLHYQSGDPGAMEAALRKLCADVEAAVQGGCEVLVLSDRLPDGEEHSMERPPIPALLAIGAVHHHLIRTGLRTETSIVADTAQCVSTHQLAVMVGYGAHAVCPYLGFETARQWRSASRTEALIRSGKVADVSITAAQKNYKKALEKGLLKILSKMGISLLSCYHGAQIFEIYGLGKEVVDLAFFGSVSRIGGLSLADAQRESESFWVKVSSRLDPSCCTIDARMSCAAMPTTQPATHYHQHDHVTVQALPVRWPLTAGLGFADVAPATHRDSRRRHPRSWRTTGTSRAGRRASITPTTSRWPSSCTRRCSWEAAARASRCDVQLPALGLMRFRSKAVQMSLQSVAAQMCGCRRWRACSRTDLKPGYLPSKPTTHSLASPPLD